MAQSWMLDPSTGDYVMEGGAPVQSDSLVVPAYFRLKTNRLGWMYAPDTKFGSDLYLIKRNRTGGDTSRIESAASVAIQPILDDGRAIGATVSTTFASRNNVGLDITLERQRGVLDQLQIPTLGA